MRLLITFLILVSALVAAHTTREPDTQHHHKQHRQCAATDRKYIHTRPHTAASGQYDHAQMPDPDLVPLATTYDYIIVGAGGAGSIVAAGLASAFPTKQILLVEAGPLTGNADNEQIRDPAQWLGVLANDTLEWRFESVPQANMFNRTLPLGFAKGTGGSVMHNGMAWVRGGHGWMDRWESEWNCTGWNSTTITAALEMVETQLAVILPGNDTQGVTDTLYNATVQAGWPIVANANLGPSMFGLSPLTMTIAANQPSDDDLSTLNSLPDDIPFVRVTSWSSYISTASTSDDFGTASSENMRTRSLVPNLFVATGLLALQVVFDSTQSPVQAIGLIVYDESSTCIRTLSVTPENGEVFLSAGTINSPTILQRSGIGNRTTLESLGIDVIVDLPGVGQHLLDDLAMTMVWTIPEEVVILNQLPAGGFFGAILFTPSEGVNASSTRVAAATESVRERGADTSLYELDESAAASAADLLVDQSFDDKEVLTSLTTLFSTTGLYGSKYPSEWRNGLVLFPNVMQLKSSGSVTLQSKDDILAPPIIDPAYLSIPSDLDRMVDGVNQARHLMEQSAWSQWQLTEVSPGPTIQSPEEIGTWAAQNAGTGFHMIGTCRMGADPSVDPLAVLDPLSLRPYGTLGLRVIDASSIPMGTSANTQAVTMALAQRATQFIIEEVTRKVPLQHK